MLELKNLVFEVTDDKGRTVRILDDISLTVPDGKFYVITGPNGGGKSTLARVIMGLERPTSGKIIYNGIDITELDVTEKAKLGIGYAFQQPPRFKGLTVNKMLALAAGKALSEKECCTYLAKVGLCSAEYVKRELDASLSGGEMKRIEISRQAHHHPRSHRGRGTGISKGTPSSMYIFPAIDLYGGKAVRLYKGDYAQMTVYSDNPIEIARDFEAAGARFIHMVDLEGARDGSTPNLPIVADVARNTSLFVEIGGGIRDMETVEKYLSAGVSRVILGTAAVNNETFLREAVEKHGEKIAVGADVKDGYIAIKGWLEQSAYTLEAFMEKMQALGVKTVICTDISKDGAMKGTNRELYRDLSQKFSMDIVASGGVSTMEDISALTAMNLYGAIIGKAYYTGAIDLAEAIRVAEGKEATV